MLFILTLLLPIATPFTRSPLSPIVRMQVLRAFSRLDPRVFDAILGFTFHTQTGDNVIPAVMFSPAKEVPAGRDSGVGS